MKKILFLAVFITTSLTTFAQVGINTKEPQGALDVVSSTSGIIVPRVAYINAVTTPVNGMIVYEIYNKCIRAYEDGAWSDCLNGKVANGPPIDVTSPTGKVWMDRNLGATQVATSSTDYLSYGDLYQWGRGADGHQLINRTAGTAVNGVTSTLSSADVPGDALFIITNVLPYNWRSPKNENLWQGVNGVNNPCPIEYRLPTEEELNQERLLFSTQDATGAFESVLKLPMGGYRSLVNGLFDGTGIIGEYWSSTGGEMGSSFLSITGDNAAMASEGRAYGFSVRCIKD